MKRSHSFLPVLIEETLSAHYVSGSIVGTGDIAVNASGRIPV